MESHIHVQFTLVHFLGSSICIKTICKQLREEKKTILRRSASNAKAVGIEEIMSVLFFQNVDAARAS